MHTRREQNYIDRIEKELYLCKKCVEDSKLKTFFQIQNLEKKRCSFCNKRSQECVDIFKNDEFYDLISAVVRYHYSEDRYNSHWGGDDINYLFDSNNFILNYNNMNDNNYIELAIDELSLRILDNSHGVWVFCGHSDGGRGCYFTPIKEQQSSRIKHLESILLKENYFLHENSIKDIFLKYGDQLKSTLEINSIFYRARIGYKQSIKIDNGVWQKEECRYIPYKRDGISAPSTSIVSGGRLNRHGVSFLYLATNISTSINEVRPDPGHYVSVGKFKSTKSLNIIDFDRIFINLSTSESDLDKYTLLNHIDQLFSRPITKDERHLYIITQFFSDIFRKIGFDAVKFTSSVGNGQNLLVFNPKDFKYIRSNENKVYKIKNIKYSTSALKN